MVMLVSRSVTEAANKVRQGGKNGGATQDSGSTQGIESVKFGIGREGSGFGVRGD